MARDFTKSFTPLEIMPRCSIAGLDFRIIPAGFNAPLEFLTGFTKKFGHMDFSDGQFTL